MASLFGSSDEILQRLRLNQDKTPADVLRLQQLLDQLRQLQSSINKIVIEFQGTANKAVLNIRL
jgi:hypothetical protein